MSLPRITDPEYYWQASIFMIVGAMCWLIVLNTLHLWLAALMALIGIVLVGGGITLIVVGLWRT